jgi:hypothetical protein
MSRFCLIGVKRPALVVGEIYEVTQEFSVVPMRSERASFSLKGKEKSLYQIL